MQTVEGIQSFAMNTRNKDVDAQEDWAFDKLDELMDTAVWTNSLVTLRPGKNTIYCYDLDMLGRELLDLAVLYVNAKFKRCDARLDDVVSNILEEYETELTNHNIVKPFKRKRRLM